MLLIHTRKPGYIILLMQSCQFPIHCPNIGMREKNVLHAWNSIAHRADTLLFENAVESMESVPLKVTYCCVQE